MKKLISAIAITLATCFCFTACAVEGYQGEQGIQGIQGIQGEKGDKGDKGDTGAKGDKGDTGEQGIQGEKGDKGEPGKDGTKVTIGPNGNWFLDGVDTGVKASCDCGCHNSGDNGDSGDDSGSGDGNGGGEVEEDDYTPVVRFAVTSDVHIRDAEDRDFQSRARLSALFDSAYKYSESQTAYTKLDGIFFAGDYSDTGTEKQQRYFFNYLEENAKPETTTWAVLGNHEFYSTGNVTEANVEIVYDNFLEYSGYDSVDEHLEINGFHYIFLAMDRYNNLGDEFFTDSKLNWLDAELTKASNADPTGEKPIFVFQHQAPENTMLGSVNTEGDADLTKVLAKYPQVVDFSGHTHRPITDPRSIWQGSFTALNTGTLAYLGVNIAGHPNYDQMEVIATNDRGSWYAGSGGESLRNFAMYYIVEVDANNVVRILTYDILTDSLYGEPIILDSIGHPENFTYTNARKDVSPAPVFAQGAQLAVKTTNYKQVLIEIPQATCPDLVQNYRCDIYKGTTFVRSDYRLACSYYGKNTPSIIDAPITGLDPSTAYTVKVYAINSWGIASEPLVATVTTTTIDATTPDILSVRFNTDGSAVNTITDEILRKEGSASVAGNATLGKNVATFDGDDAYSFNRIVDWYNIIADGFTLEAYVYLDKKPTASEGYVNLLSNQEGGGFGFEYDSNGRLYFYCYAGGRYRNPYTTVSTGQWLHLVGTYDGSKVKLYVNGSLVGQQSGGTFQKPSLFGQSLYIGADSGYGEKGDRFFNGKIAVANMYSNALSAKQIATLYENF